MFLWTPLGALPAQVVVVGGGTGNKLPPGYLVWGEPPRGETPTAQAPAPLSPTHALSLFDLLPSFP